MQNSSMDIKTKYKVLLYSLVAVILATVPFSISSFQNGNELHILIHTCAIILSVFLSVVGVITYRSFKTTRLFLVMCAFVSICLAEITALSLLLLSTPPSFTNYDSLITHGLILLMLSFFAFGIFRKD